MPSAETNRFWQFSLDFYRRDGVAEACLTLQDRLGLDVNILLYAAWLASQGRTASVADFEQVDLLVAPWREEVIRPLRRIRRWLKEPGPDAPMPAASGRIVQVSNPRNSKRRRLLKT